MMASASSSKPVRFSEAMTSKTVSCLASIAVAASATAFGSPGGQVAGSVGHHHRIDAVVVEVRQTEVAVHRLHGRGGPAPHPARCSADTVRSPPSTPQSRCSTRKSSMSSELKFDSANALS